MKRILPALVVGAVFLILAAAFGLLNRDDAVQKVTLTGSSTIAPLMAEIGRRYETLHPGHRVDVQTGGSSRGIADAEAMIADIGMVSRNPKDGEEAQLAWYPLAQDGLALVSHASNPLSGLTKQQVIDIYTGKISQWRELGSKINGEIIVIHKAEGRSTLEVFLSYLGLSNDDIDADVIVGDNQQGIKTVATNPQAIAYVSIGTAEYEAAQGTTIKLLDIDGIKASVKNVTSGAYPITRTLHVVTKLKDDPQVKDFLRFARSARVNDLIEGQFFVPLSQ